MDSKSDDVRIGCVWTIINLIVTEETFDARGNTFLNAFLYSFSAECRKRGIVLRDLGIVEKLSQMKDQDSSLDVKERAKTALAHFDNLNI